MKKKPAEFLTLFYISTKGYIIRVDGGSTATFTSMDDAKEYILFKGGQKISEKFAFAFEEITTLICGNSIFKEVYSKSYFYGNSQMKVVSN